MFPRMILVVFALLNTAMIFAAFKSGGVGAGGITLTELKMPLLYYAGIVLYIVLFRFFGYFPATVVMLTVFMAICKVRPWWKIALIVGGFTGIIYLLFVVWLQTRLI